MTRPDSDVDVLIVGTPDEDAVARRTIEAGVLLAREVNPVTFTPAEWRARRVSQRPFDRSLATGPKAWLVREGAPVRPGVEKGRPRVSPKKKRHLGPPRQARFRRILRIESPDS